MTQSRPATVIVLAAGEGTRMRSSTAKVLHRFFGRTLLGHVVSAVAPLSPAQTVVVVGHQREAVQAHLAEIAPAAQTVVQEHQKGTGHAVRIALSAGGCVAGTVVVVCGDTPLLTSTTLEALVTSHEATSSPPRWSLHESPIPRATAESCVTASGAVMAIVEHKDADRADPGDRRDQLGDLCVRR